jgi:hypothetical protein
MEPDQRGERVTVNRDQSARGQAWEAADAARNDVQTAPQAWFHPVVKVTSAISRARLWFDLAHIYHASKISADGEFFRLDPNPDRR